MKSLYTTHTIKFNALILGLILSSATLQSCTTPKDKFNNTPQSVETDSSKTTWRSLISTDNLNDWQKIGGEAAYQLEGNTIVGTSINSSSSTYFTTGEVFSDFIFEVDVWAEAPLNSGVQFRSKKIQGEKGETVAGYQMEIDTASRAWSGGIYDQGRRGWLYTLSRNQACSQEFKVSDWNTYRIEAVGQEIRTFINNLPCSYIADDLSSSGFIALQIHSAGAEKANKTVKWRAPKILTENIQKHLRDTPNIEQFNYIDNTLTAQQTAKGWHQVWDSHTAQSLKTTGDWQTQNGVLAATATQQKNTIIVPIKTANFELEFDVKSSKNSDNGIHYLLDENDKGLEFQLSSESTLKQTANNKSAMGAIFGLVAPTNLSEPSGWKHLRINKTWNRVRLVIQGNHIEHWINNIKMVDHQYAGKLPSQPEHIIIENSTGAIEISSINIRPLEPMTASKPKASNPGDREGHVMEKVVPEAIIPEAPILTTEQALKSFEIHEDFALEVIADSPLVFDPVHAIYDAAGRIWILEMTTYMQDTLATGEMTHDSQIVVLTDTNQDGKMDKRQVVLANLILPRALAFVDKGILWADNVSLYFSELQESNGQISVLKTEVIDKEYAAGGNVEHKPNGLLFSLDNWYYNAKSNKRYRPYPLNAALPAGTKEIYRNRYWKMLIGQTEFRGQWGISQDDYGRHYFLDNSTPLQTTSFLPNVALRNPKQTFPKTLLNQNVGSNDIFPIRVTPGINRGYMKDMYNKAFKLKHNTAAGGPVIYRGNQFPAQYSNISLATEPAGNLIRANKISDQDGLVSGENLFVQQEILASTDERFRPVNLNNTPDGTVIVVDFYHGILQHRTYLTTYLSEQIKTRDLDRSKHIGRLYRLKHKSSAVKKVELLDTLSAPQLLPYLAHDNGWHRDMAQQLLVMKQDKSVVDALKSMATSHSNHLAQIKALWVLEGLGENTLAVLTEAAHTANAKIKRSIYRLAELLPQSAALNSWLIKESESVSQEASQALVLAAGTHKAWQATANIIKLFGTNAFVLASLANNEQVFLAVQGNDLPAQAVSEISILKDIVKPSKSKVSAEIMVSMQKGKKLYNGEAGCFGCHGADGEGNPMIPPLNKSEWVTGGKNRLSAILLHGFSGPITVADKTYNNGMVMPGLTNTATITDEDIAHIATYIRNAWDNSAGEVSTQEVKSVRHHTQQQRLPFTTETIKNVKGH